MCLHCPDSVLNLHLPLVLFCLVCWFSQGGQGRWWGHKWFPLSCCVVLGSVEWRRWCLFLCSAQAFPRLVIQFCFRTNGPRLLLSFGCWLGANTQGVCPSLQARSWPFHKTTSLGSCELIIVWRIFWRLVSLCNLSDQGPVIRYTLALRCQHMPTLPPAWCSSFVSMYCTVGVLHLLLVLQDVVGSGRGGLRV